MSIAILEHLEYVRNKISALAGVNVNNDEVELNNDNVAASKIESLFKSKFFSSQLLEIYGLVNRVKFSWEANNSIFGPKCRFGYFNLLSLEEIQIAFNDQVEQANEAKSNSLEDEKGYAAIINDWPYWLPIFRFPSGDSFCVETRNTNLPIVFLEHDVMDCGPNLHGMQIAPNLESLLNLWSHLLFVEVRDWTEVCDANGINEQNELFSKILSL